MADLFVIQLIKKGGQKGYLIDAPDGFKISIESLDRDVKTFTSYDEAQQFIRDKKLNNSKTNALVRDMEELLSMNTPGLVTAEQLDPNAELVYLENERGQKIFYNTKGQFYFFSDRSEAGFCVYKNGKDVEEMAANLGREYSMVVSIKKVSDIKK